MTASTKSDHRTGQSARTPKVWFITGASRGFGRAWTAAALERGDRVAAAARDISTLDDLAAVHGEALLPITLDVNDREADFAAIRRAHETFGRLDVVVNNAGFGQYGFVEEVSEREARAQLETNLFGALWVTQASLPYLRAQGGGHIIQVSSAGGVTASPMTGIYSASKWALEGFSQALSQEVADFGIAVTLIEPSGFATGWRTSSQSAEEPLDDYDRLREVVNARRVSNRATAGDPSASAKAILEIVDAHEPPSRIFFGSSLGAVKADYARRIETWETWNDLSLLAHG